MTTLKHVDFEVPQWGELAAGPQPHVGTPPVVTYRQAVESLSGRLLDLRLGETSGTTAFNTGSAGVNGTYVSMHALGASGLIVGDADKAADFNGNTSGGLKSHVVLPWLFPVSSDFTLLFWVRNDGQTSSTASGIRPLIWYGHSANPVVDKHEFVLSLRRVDNRLQLTTRNGPGGAAVTISSAAAIAVGATAMVHVTRSGTTQTLGLNGATAASSTTANHRVNSDLYLGGSPTDDASASRYFHGLIDELILLNYALDATTIADLYDKGT